MADSTTPSSLTPPSTTTTVETATDIAQKADTIATNIAAISTDVAQAAAAIATANVWTAILGFFTALPGIVKITLSFIQWLDVVSGNNPKEYVAKIGQVFAQLSNAKTEQDYNNAAKNLAGIINGLPPN